MSGTCEECGHNPAAMRRQLELFRHAYNGAADQASADAARAEEAEQFRRHIRVDLGILSRHAAAGAPADVLAAELARFVGWAAPGGERPAGMLTEPLPDAYADEMSTQDWLDAVRELETERAELHTALRDLARTVRAGTADVRPPELAGKLDEFAGRIDPNRALRGLLKLPDLRFARGGPQPPAPEGPADGG